MKGSIGLLKKDKLSEKQTKIVSRMELMILEMQDLVESLLLLSREQNTELTNEKYVVNDLLKVISTNIISTFPDKNIEMDWQAKNLIECSLSEQLFVIVINNLLRNACTYSPQNSTITIQIQNSKISITDQGQGMTAEQLKNIFKPFYRVDEHSNNKGFGLGLAIVEWICKQCDWNIHFESTVGIGTTATLNLKNVKILA